MKALLCISGVILGARLGATGAESVDARLRDRVAARAPSPADEKSEPDPRQHWAFQAPRRPPVPPIANRQSSIANPVDAFILANNKSAASKLSRKHGRKFS